MWPGEPNLEGVLPAPAVWYLQPVASYVPGQLLDTAPSTLKLQITQHASLQYQQNPMADFVEYQQVE